MFRSDWCFIKLRKARVAVKALAAVAWLQRAAGSPRAHRTRACGETYGAAIDGAEKAPLLLQGYAILAEARDLSVG